MAGAGTRNNLLGMAIRQPDRQPHDEAVEYWSAVLAGDFKTQRRDRTNAARARDWGLHPRTLLYYLAEVILPPKTEVGIRIGLAVGMTEDEVLSFYRRLWSRRSTNPVTARELSSPRRAA